MVRLEVVRGIVVVVGGCSDRSGPVVCGVLEAVPRMSIVQE